MLKLDSMNIEFISLNLKFDGWDGNLAALSEDDLNTLTGIIKKASPDLPTPTSPSDARSINANVVRWLQKPRANILDADVTRAGNLLVTLFGPYQQNEENDNASYFDDESESVY